MNRLLSGTAHYRALLIATAGALGAWSLAGAATAQALPAIPAGSSDCVLFNGIVNCVAEPAQPANEQDGILNTGIATNAPNGFGVKLQDHDLPGKENGSPTPVDSDYIYAFAGFIYFDSDSENFIPDPTHPIDVANLQAYPEAGTWQDISAYWYDNGYEINFQDTMPLYVFSDTPEPSVWMMMLAGAGLAGAALRARRSAKTSGAVA
jgi:hypothetical protein